MLTLLMWARTRDPRSLLDEALDLPLFSTLSQAGEMAMIVLPSPNANSMCNPVLQSGAS